MVFEYRNRNRNDHGTHFLAHILCLRIPDPQGSRAALVQQSVDDEVDREEIGELITIDVVRCGFGENFFEPVDGEEFEQPDVGFLVTGP